MYNSATDLEKKFSPAFELFQTSAVLYKAHRLRNVILQPVFVSIESGL
ncbi:hypothetical protein [Leptospira kmetyi]|nr:hypothetical protein [Leptospira kmetyi]